MQLRHFVRVSTVVILCVFASTFVHAKKSQADTDTGTKCHMQFTLSSWSVFYKSGKGRGTISCDNGQSAPIAIRTHGGGITFGKSDILDGHGTFTRVADIHELFGAYAASAAHAGADDAASAHAIWKGDVGLALSGTGKGWDVGIDFGSFKITPQ